jgi:hypothetical protein
MHLDEPRIFFDGYPKWLQDEINKRKDDPDWSDKFGELPVVYIQIGALSPQGNVQTYRWYTYQPKRITLEDFARAIRFFEDRFMAIIHKSGFVQNLVEQVRECGNQIRRRKFLRHQKTMYECIQQRYEETIDNQTKRS